MPTRFCSKCGSEKDLETGFYNNKCGRDGKDAACKACRASRASDWVSENRESHNANTRAKYAIKSLVPGFKESTWAARNPQKAARWRKEWYVENRQERLDYLAVYRSKNAESLASKRRQRYQNIISTVLEKLGSSCALCGESTRDLLTVDHVMDDGNIERHQATSFQIKVSIASDKADLTRYRILCRNCNSRRFMARPTSLFRPAPSTGRLLHCRTCRLDLDECNFSVRPPNSDIDTGNECRGCLRDRRDRLRRECFALYGVCCVSCGLTDELSLCLDHVKDDGQFRRNAFFERLGFNLHPKILSGELLREDFQLLCHNCNYLKKMTRSVGVKVVSFSFSDVSFSSSPGSKTFLESYHYAGFGRSATKSYAAVLDGEVIGEFKLASLVRQRVATSSGFPDSRSLELDRFCIKPGYHKKNFSSFMMAACIRLVRRDFPNLAALISFADPRFGHSGGLYRASNWTFVGRTSTSYHYVDEDGSEVNKKVVYVRAVSVGLKESEYVARLGLRKVKTPRKLKFVYPLADR